MTGPIVPEFAAEDKLFHAGWLRVEYEPERRVGGADDRDILHELESVKEASAYWPRTSLMSKHRHNKHAFRSVENRD